MPHINIQTREDENNRSIIKPDTRLKNGLVLRPISLGSLEILRQLGNPLCSGVTEAVETDIRVLTEYIWVHAAPIENVVDAVYNTPSQVPKKVALFCMNIKPNELSTIINSLVADSASVEMAGTIPQSEADDESPNAQAPRSTPV